MRKSTPIVSLRGIVLFDVNLYGQKEGRDAFVAYNILAQDRSGAIDVATEIAKREGYTIRGLTIEPDVRSQGCLCADSKYLEDVVKNKSSSVRYKRKN